jgi:spore maturation protein CgeB
MSATLRVVILGLSVTSSWGNGHATTYRGLIRGLSARGHDILFLERDLPWYAENRDLPRPPGCRVELYASHRDLRDRFEAEVKDADLVIVGSYVPEGVAIGEWVTRTARGVTAFYDIDTPVTLTRLERGGAEYLSLELVPRYHLYLSFTGGPILEILERHFGAQLARPLYCSADPANYYPEICEPRWDLGYMGTYSDDRQPALDRFLLGTALRLGGSRFVVAGPQYPESIRWPANVERIVHLSPAEHRGFYNAQRFTLNLTRASMIVAGYSPSVRLFEAAACGTPIISDHWDGLERFFEPGSEILVARTQADLLGYLQEMPDAERLELGRRARARVLEAHTAAHRAVELEGYLREVLAQEPALSR